MKTLVAVLILCALPVLAQDQPAPHKPATQKPLPVSKYLRKVGLLYLQTIEEFSKHCEGLVSDPAAQRECSAAMESWESTFELIEGQVDIELSKSHSEGDARTWTLLKNAQMSKSMYLSGHRLAGIMQTAEGGKAIMDLWVGVYPKCYTYAHETVVDGTYIGDGGCAELVKKATDHKSTK